MSLSFEFDTYTAKVLNVWSSVWVAVFLYTLYTLVLRKKGHLKQLFRPFLRKRRAGAIIPCKRGRIKAGFGLFLRKGDYSV